MRRTIILILFIQLIIWGCGKNKETGIDDPDIPSTALTLEVSEKKLLTQAEGGELNFNITSNCDWVIRSSNSWCKLSSDQGNGNASITINVLPFEEYEQRSAEITVKADTMIRIIEVIQKQKNALILSDNHFNNIPVEGKEISVEVKSNVDYDIIIPDEIDWVKQVLPSRALESNNYKFEITANSLFDEREGIIIFEDKINSLSDTAYIIQEGNKSERAILVSLYHSLNGDNWEKKANWLSDKPLGEWYGITTNAEGKVTKIEFNEISIKGEIPANLKYLTDLEYLYLDYQYLSKAYLTLVDIDEYPTLKELKINGDVKTLKIRKWQTQSYQFKSTIYGALNLDTLIIEDCPNMEELVISTRAPLEHFSIQKCPNLKVLGLNSQLTSDKRFDVDLSEFPQLMEFSSECLGINKLNVSNCTKLTKLSLNKNSLNELDISNNLELELLRITDNLLTYLDISKYLKLTKLTCWSNQIQELILNSNLEGTLACQDNQLHSLNLANTPKLKTILCYNNKLQTLDLTNNLNLESIECNNNQLQTLNLPNSPKLRYLECNNNKLSSINISQNINLYTFKCSNNQIQSLDFTNNSALGNIWCENNKLTVLDITPILNHYVTLKCLNNPMSTIWVWEGFDLEKSNIKAPEGVEYKVKQ